MNTRKGFTLVELLVVIAILAILATVSVVGYTSFIANADNTAAQTEAADVDNAILTNLTLNKYCKITGADSATIYVRRNGSSYDVSATVFDGTKEADYVAITNLAELATGLSLDADGALVYTKKGVVVDVKSGKIAE